MKKRKKLLISFVSVTMLFSLSSCQIVAFTTSGESTSIEGTDSSTTSNEETSEVSSDSVEDSVSSVAYVPVSSLYISEEDFALKVGDTKNLYAQISPKDASIVGVTWHSSDESVLTVSGEGLVTAKAPGKVKLTCVSQDNSDIKDEINISVYSDGSGFSKLPVNATVKDLHRHYSESLDDQKVLIVPIHIKDETSDSRWNDSKIAKLNNIVFNQDDPASYVSYYHTASNGRLTMSGEVSPIYQTEYTRSQLEDDNRGKGNIFTMFSNATEWLNETDPTIDIAKDYDSNHDGYIDNIHFIVDATTSEWGSNLWPHMSQTGNYPSTGDNLPTVNTYSLSNTGELNDAYTFIHEQGHIFGLQDYYNYSSLSDSYGNPEYVDYVGCLDMQSYTCFDWNVYSKLNMGWVDPYYFDGTKESATIEIGPAASTGDCIIVGDNWNGNAFDEYITIELFADQGNNSLFWNNYSSLLGNGGIRLSHVDSRLVNGENEEDIDNITDGDLYTPYYLKYSNSVNSKDCYGYSFNDDYHLLNVIQAGGKNTFSKPTTDNYSLFLNQNDLFQTGDVFSMAKYGQEFFPNKTTLDNGDDFPYIISFDKVTPESATITITKI